MEQTKNWKEPKNNGRNWKNGRGGVMPTNNHSLAYGKCPPKEEGLECAILGALLLEKSAFDKVAGYLQPEYFYSDAHQLIYTAMVTLSQKSIPIDILTVVHELKSSGKLEYAGGPLTITKLTNGVVSSANIEAHVLIVKQKYIQREIIRVSGNLITMAYEDTTDVFDLLDEAEKGLFSLSTGHLKSDYRRFEALYQKETAELMQRMQAKTDYTGVPTGSKPLDKLTGGGWQSGDLIILGARPSVGKTAFALNLARKAALHEDHPTGVGVFSLEMSTQQVTQRMISAQSNIPLRKIRRGKIDNPELQALHRACVHTIAMAPIFIDDTPGLNIYELRTKCRKLVSNEGVGLIIIDYLQLMTGPSDGRSSNREQEISKISRDLKGLAKELQVPIIALCQLSRDIEKRKDGIPQLSDLRESGAIEQDADVVMFLGRADYQKQDGEIDPSLQGDAELRIAKNRNGELDVVAYKANLSVQRFDDIDLGEPAVERFITRKEAEAKFARPYQRNDFGSSPTMDSDSGDELPF